MIKLFWNSTYKNFLRALRLTEQKWQEHLRRFDAIEDRSRPDSGEGKEFAKLHNLPPFDTAEAHPPDLSDGLIRRPMNHYTEHPKHTQHVHMQGSYIPSDSANASKVTSPVKNRSRRASYTKPKTNLRRTLSAESLADEKSGLKKYIDSSDEEQDKEPVSGQRSNK